MTAAQFFAEPALQTMRISPDGRRLAVLTGRDDRQTLDIVDIDSGERATILDVARFSEKDASLLGIGWLDDTTVAARYSEARAGIERMLDTRGAQYLLLVRLPGPNEAPEVLRVRTQGYLVDLLPGSAGEFLYARSGVFSRVYRLRVDGLQAHGARLGKTTRIDGGQFVSSNAVAEVKGYATRWFVGDDASPTAVMHIREQGGLALSRLGTEEPEELTAWTVDALSASQEGESKSLLLPVAATDSATAFYCLDYGDEDQRAVYQVDYESGDEIVVYESDDGDIVDLVFSQVGRSLVGVKVLRDGSVHTDYLGGATEAGAIEGAGAGDLRVEIDGSLDGTRRLHYTEGHSQPGQFFLSQDGQTPGELVGSIQPHLDGALAATLDEGRVEVEGLEIPYLLSLPASDAPAPLVVLPHGGPIGPFDTRYYDATTQFLAANGYAVLRVNFRGSGGHSDALREAGKRELGGLMLADIQAAAEQVAARPDIDGERACVFGMSYGGYAATMLAIRHPAFYDCAVNVSGISDVNLYVARTGLSERLSSWLREHIGDPYGDYDGLKAISPAYKVEQLERPLLIVHGADDEIVDVEHAWRLRRMLDRHGGDYEWHIYPESGHSFADLDETVDFHQRVEAFLYRHLFAAP